MPSSLTIIILAYNSAHILVKCLEKINFDKYKVVVVDNASSDNSIDLIKEKFPQAKIIKLDKNVGYGNGNNAALEKVETEFALVLNPDAMIFENDIEIVLDAMKKNPQVAIAGPLILRNFPASKKEIDEWMERMNKDLVTIKSRYCEKLEDGFDSQFLSGSCIFLRMSVFKKLGFFEKDIFMFYEDNEICERSKANGYKNLVVPAAHVFHLEAGSSRKCLRLAFRRGWHLGWSKLYWKQLRKNKFKAKKSALRLFLLNLFWAFTFLFSGKLAEASQNFGTSFGSFSFLFGLKAFKKNGSARG
jgi:GT2 family glycosyltransferase